MYAVKTIFLTLQGEGANAGRPAVFCRLAGCNLGYGVCPWCDTDWVGTDGEGGGAYPDAGSLAAAAAGLWRGDRLSRFLVLTGGEPTLQADGPLVAAFHGEGFAVAIETNGTRPLPDGIDWITVSPKAGAPLIVTAGDELKLPYPQEGVDPAAFARLPFARFYLQPIDGPDLAANTAAAIDYCLAHPKWRLSVQAHKVWGVA